MERASVLATLAILVGSSTAWAQGWGETRGNFTPRSTPTHTATAQPRTERKDVALPQGAGCDANGNCAADCGLYGPHYCQKHCDPATTHFHSWCNHVWYAPGWGQAECECQNGATAAPQAPIVACTEPPATLACAAANVISYPYPGCSILTNACPNPLKATCIPWSCDSDLGQFNAPACICTATAKVGPVVSQPSSKSTTADEAEATIRTQIKTLIAKDKGGR